MGSEMCIRDRVSIDVPPWSSADIVKLSKKVLININRQLLFSLAILILLLIDRIYKSGYAQQGQPVTLLVITDSAAFAFCSAVRLTAEADDALATVSGSGCAKATSCP